MIPARDPQHAVQIASTFAHEIHMFLTDVVMPGMSGRELAAASVKNVQAFACSFMSGYTDNVITTGGCWKKAWRSCKSHFPRDSLAKKSAKCSRATAANK